MRRELDNRTKRAVVFAVIHTVRRLADDPTRLEDEFQPLLATMLGDLIMTIEGGESGEPYVFDAGEDWITMYKETEAALRRNFPESFSSLILV